jgi:uncharacterized protein YdbL (DUF1318 family)
MMMHCSKILQYSLGIIALCLVLVTPAFAVDLGSAKSSGLVGETSSGYIAAIKPSAEVDALVSSINSQRKAQYQQIASNNGISLSAVEVRAGQKAIGKTPAGHYVNTGNGWQQK